MYNSAAKGRARGTMTTTCAMKRKSRSKQTFEAIDGKYGFSANNSKMVVGLNLDEDLVFQGILNLRVYQGRVNVLGKDIGIEQHSSNTIAWPYTSLYSPKWANALSIESIGGKPASKIVSTFASSITTVGTERNEEYDAERLARKIALIYPIVLILSRKTVDFTNIDCAASDSSLGFQIWTSTTDVKNSVFVPVPNRLAIQIFPSWKDSTSCVLQSESLNQKILVCGGKGVGKSTYCRYLINTALNSHRVVAFLDTDIGQPEFTPAGLMSLHLITTPLLGPSHTHLTIPLRTLFFGNTSHKVNPIEYSRMVKSLFDLYCQRITKWNISYNNIPLIINTDGWIKGMGHDVLCTTIESIEPTHIVQLLGDSVGKQFTLPRDDSSDLKNWLVYPVDSWSNALLNSAVPLSYSARKLRNFRTRSYFLEKDFVVEDLDDSDISVVRLISADENRIARHSAITLSKQSAYCIPFDKVCIRFTQDYCNDNASALPRAEVLRRLNVSVVGLGIAPEASLKAVESCHDVDEINAVYPRIIVNETSCIPCVGLGIIREIDIERQEFHVLTPVDSKILAHVNVLMAGMLNLPVELLAQDSTLAPSYVTNLCIESEGTGSSIMASRSNIKRRKHQK